MELMRTGEGEEEKSHILRVKGGQRGLVVQRQWSFSYNELKF